jgi:hypothetical protein
VNDHQLAAALARVLIPAALGGKSDRPHGGATGGQPVARRAPVEMA